MVAATCARERFSVGADAYRAKNIQNKPKVNEKMTQKAYVRELLNQITLLKRENEVRASRVPPARATAHGTAAAGPCVQVLRTKNGIILPPEQFEALTKELASKRRQLEEIELTVVSREQEWQALKLELNLKETELAATQEVTHAQPSRGARGACTRLHAQAKEQLEAALAETRAALEQTRMELEATRRRLREQTFLTAQHAATESQLLQTAATLKGTAETVIAHKNLLHDKIGTSRAAEAPWYCSRGA